MYSCMIVDLLLCVNANLGRPSSMYVRNKLNSDRLKLEIHTGLIFRKTLWIKTKMIDNVNNIWFGNNVIISDVTIFHGLIAHGHPRINIGNWWKFTTSPLGLTEFSRTLNENNKTPTFSFQRTRSSGFSDCYPVRFGATREWWTIVFFTAQNSSTYGNVGGFRQILPTRNQNSNV